MASRAEIDENGDTKGNMWVLEQKLNQPMNEEAGKLKNMYREKKFSAILLLRLAIQSLGVVYGDLGTSPFVSTLLMMVTLKKLDSTWCTVSLENACLQTLVGAAGEVTPYIVTWCSEATQEY